MREFKDKDGRVWRIHISVDEVREVRRVLGVDLARVLEDEHEREKLRDLCLRVDVLFVLCRQQAEENQVNAIDFGRGLEGDLLQEAEEALYGAILDFFPSRTRALLQKVLERMRVLTSEEESRLATMLDGPQGDALLRAAMQATGARTQETQVRSQESEKSGSHPGS